jgi:DNA-directed RNA polymerase sigma subunit (sigma70/sigma32)
MIPPWADSEMEGSDQDNVSEALGELSPLGRRIIEARFLCKRSERKDRRALADELGLTVGFVEELEEHLLNKMRQLMDS